MFLLDSNVWLQILRDRSDAEQARDLLVHAPNDRLFVSDFTVFTIGLVLRRFDQLDHYKPFIRESLIGQEIAVLRLDLGDLAELPTRRGILNLDFDDTYQYLVAEQYDLQLVSFDDDFDKTQAGRLTPADALAQLKKNP